LNLYKWDEFKDTDTIQLTVWFLDAVIEEFIQKAEQIKGIEDAVRFAKKSRAIGLGKNNAQYKLL
jgi:ribonucleoside-diphosphate reductase alpha chain